MCRSRLPKKLSCGTPVLFMKPVLLALQLTSSFCASRIWNMQENMLPYMGMPMEHHVTNLHLLEQRPERPALSPPIVLSPQLSGSVGRHYASSSSSTSPLTINRILLHECLCRNSRPSLPPARLPACSTPQQHERSSTVTANKLIRIILT